MHYPIVLYPESIKQLTELPLIPESSAKISNKQENKRKKLPMVKPQFENQFQYRVLLGIWLCWLLGAIVLLLIVLVLENLLGAIFSLLAWSSLCLGAYLGTKEYYNGLKIKFFQEQIKWQRQQDAAEREQNLDVSHRKNQEKREHMLALRQADLVELISQRVEPIAIDSNARQGVSERQFRSICQRYFDKVIQAAEFEIPGNKYNYSADFLVFHGATGLGIDVEIDEPYALISKKPTHCQDLIEDRRRNQFFLSGGWMVIRFTERQIVKAPESCCKLIAQAIAFVTGDRGCLEQLEKFPDLLPEKGWTVKEAKRLARKNYRLTYLPKDVKPVNSKCGRSFKRRRF